MSEVLEFACRNDFRNWLRENCLSDAGVWLLFGKPGGPQTVKADEALEEALCFGWIDGQMKSMNETSYRKYFSLRRDNSKWSEKNKKLVEQLEKQGIMTDYGRKKIEEAKKNGQWNAPKAPAITEEEIASVAALLTPTAFCFGHAAVVKRHTVLLDNGRTDNPGRMVDGDKIKPIKIIWSPLHLAHELPSI
ncbi:MAG: YdeI/OmpD-associated family protein [Eisenbergiella sp.]